ncbi:flagellar assembly protein FliW [Paenibacillus nasutitermitis]|uniref:Flagellar assembly factor FliW n=1 Tax=Paenibacillus nasutitermitis TaxID=1652958 RepID=A0A916ZEL1_9BACL|nr:flagellar assembly protein FliW [Paenibacillus nasutitermitis]GGD92232.1 flagellar assembly factor FliW [Paenibacillus nasutitermitis]
MFIETLTWGTIEAAEEQLYHFPKGIPGFEDKKNFVLIDHEEGPFVYLQSTCTRELAFLVADPFLFFPGYEFELPEGEMKELQVDSQVVVRCILTLKEQMEQSTLNLLAPIVLNPEKRLGKQVVLHQTGYHTRHPLLSNEPHSVSSAKEVGKDAGIIPQEG